MADKTWTAADLKLGPLKITPKPGGMLHIERRYTFLDSGGGALTQIKGGRLLMDVELSALPANIQAALTAINTYTKNQALIQEGMDDT